ncbi:MAG: hypothetical protein U5L72_12380 [Bacteroidales bacterium]|nr:hypothetical protein [Bacteroidales bacterium]
MILYITAKKGNALLSTNLRVRNPQGEYPDSLLFQLLFFHGTVPRSTVYLLQVMTVIDSTRMRRNGYHYYVGDDISNFRFPDKKLLDLGNPLSSRESENLMLVETGLTSEEIGENCS